MSTQKQSGMHLKVSEIEPSKTNTRPKADYAGPEFDELKASIKAAGQAQAITVRRNDNGYEIISGERRWRATKALGMETIVAYVVEADDKQALAMQMAENNRRKDLSPLAEAEAYAIQSRDLKLPTQEIAARCGVTPAQVVRRMMLLQLAPEVKKSLEAGEMAVSVAEEFTRITDPKLQVEALREVDDFGDAKAARKTIEQNFLLQLNHAPFRVDDAKLVTGTPACGECPKRTGAQATLFAGTEKNDLCRDSKCWNTKVAAHFKAKIADLRAKGREVIEGQAAVNAMQDGRHERTTHTCYQSKGNKKWGELIKGTEYQPVLVYRDGELIELVEKSKALAVIPKKFMESGPGAATSNHDGKAKKAKGQLNKAGRKAWVDLQEPLFEKLKGKPLERLGLKGFAKIFLKHRVDYHMNRGLELRTGKSATTHANAIKEKGDQEILAILWHALIGDGVHTLNPAELEDCAAEVVSYAGLDFKATRANALAEIKKPKAKAKPSPKTKAKK